MLARVAKGAGDGYPPYNIERCLDEGAGEEGASGQRIRITIAVAGFTREQLEITLEDKQLVIRGRQAETNGTGEFLHRGIAARQFQRTFVLADGIEVAGAELKDGLLVIDLFRPEPAHRVRRIEIATPGQSG